MSIVGDILSVTKDLEGRAKDRRDIDELRQIQSLALTLQTHNAEVVERDIKVMQEIAEVKAENTKLKDELSKANAEEVRIHKATEFRKGARTGGKWLAFCPVCHLPATPMNGHENIVCSDGGCSWKSFISWMDLEGEIEALG